MSTFVYYNPKTNTIERRNPVQSAPFQMPYLISFQPQDLNYAMKSTHDMRSNPTQFQYPDNEKENLQYRAETIKKSSRPQEETRRTEREPFTSKDINSNEFLVMEDLHEDDLQKMPHYYQPKVHSKTTSHHVQDFEPERMAMKKTAPQKQQAYEEEEEEARGDFKLMRPEDLVMKYRPEDYSINERILNAKYVSAEQERTKKFVLNRMGNNIQAMEAKAKGLEKDLEMTEEETKELESKTQQIWQDIERKKFELKANQVLNRIDGAIEMNPEDDQKDRLNAFFLENRALYDEIDRVMEEGSDEEETMYVVEENHRPAKVKSSGYGRPSSSGVRNAKPKGVGVRPMQSSGYGFVSKQNKKGLDKDFGRKNIVKTVAEEKTRNATRFNMGNLPGGGGIASKRREIVVKNPKKVEDALQRAKEIADMY